MFAHNKIFAILISLFFVAAFANAIQAQTSPSTLDSLAAQLVLLRNEYQQIPIRHLDRHHFRSLTFGLEANKAFQSTLEKYISFEHFSGADALKDFAKAKKTLKTNVQNIVSIHLKRASDLERLPQLLEILKAKGQLEHTILVVFNDDLKAQPLPDYLLEFKQLLLVKSDGPFAQSLAAQLIFGGLGAKAKLEQDWPPFSKGSGLNTEGNLRLRYALPEWLGMSGTLLRDSIGAIAEQAIEAKAFPGMQVLVVKNGQVVFHETYGHHTYRKEQAVRRNDVYDFASVSKITTALPALMKLHGKGQFELDAPFKKYFPKFKKSNKARLTFRQILAHQAQLKPWIPYWKNTVRKNGKFKWRTLKKKASRRFPIRVSKGLYLHKKYRKKIYKAIKKSPLNEELGYRYSGLAFYLFPEMLEQMTGQPFVDYLQQQFYDPLGAESLRFNPWKTMELEQIVPTERDTFFRKELLDGFVHDEGAAMMGGISANAGLFGNANDLAKLLQMYLNKGTYGGQRFIAASSLDTFTYCHYCEEGNRRGLGFDKPLIDYHPQRSSTARSASPESYGHSGYTGTFVWVDPRENLIYIFLSNRVHPSRESRQIYELNVRPRIHQLIYDALPQKMEK